jgi:hypothetical protein
VIGPSISTEGMIVAEVLMSSSGGVVVAHGTFEDSEATHGTTGVGVAMCGVASVVEAAWGSNPRGTTGVDRGATSGSKPGGTTGVS